MTQEVQRYKGRDKMEVLKAVWGFDSFREGQEEIIDKVLAGEDVLVLAKTSFGKSLSYQLPALILDGTAIIVSPLLSLQEDQVNSLKAKGVSAELLNSTQPAAEKKRVKDAIKKGEVDLVFAAPETLVQPTNLKWFKKNADVSFLALDEAHCFPGDTQIATEEGPLSFYQLALRQEERTLPKALSKNLQTGSTEYKQITKVFKNPSQPLLKVTLESGSVFLVTDTHSIFTDKGEVLAKDLTVDHKLISTDQECHIQSIERVSDTYDDLYDMEVEDNHNYFIHCRRGSVCKPQEPILVHNCISQYGSDFRPKYFQVGEIKDELNCPVLAVTATADKVTLDDVKSVLGFGKGKRPFSKIEHYLDRPSIHYHILRKSFAPVQQVLSLIRERDSKETGIIYCTTRKEVDSLQYELYKKRVKVVKYHAGMTKEDRQKSLEAWLAGDAQVAVCTIAFGMGIDKPDVRYVIHYNIPSTIEGYIQETGRASRDGLPSDVYMLYDYRDVGKIQWILKQSTENKVTLSKKLKKLDQMVQIAESDDCIRAQLLGYFGQNYPRKNCGGCSNCVSHTEL